jgi:hypothetical protein
METASDCTVRLNDYTSPAEGAKLIFEDLKRKLQPRVTIANMERQKRHTDAEAAQHEIYLSLHAERFVGGEAHFAKINEHLSRPETRNVPLVISGDHGAGKTRWGAFAATVVVDPKTVRSTPFFSIAPHRHPKKMLILVSSVAGCVRPCAKTRTTSNLCTTWSGVPPSEPRVALLCVTLPVCAPP